MSFFWVIGVQRSSNFHALPVVNDDGEAAGIVTTTDFIAYF